jgi:hypothetical protein
MSGLQPPEYEAEFYQEQNKLMEIVFEKKFDNWNLSWKKYINQVYSKLNNNPYWIWVFLCGFYKFVKDEGHIKLNRKNRVYKDMQNRIYKIIGDYYQVKKYISEL